MTKSMRRKLFRSTLPRRERPVSAGRRVESVPAFRSTLPRRERRYDRSAENRDGGFDPRSREGSDQGATAAANQAETFRSTLPRRERHVPPTPANRSHSFDPRSREGS